MPPLMTALVSVAPASTCSTPPASSVPIADPGIGHRTRHQDHDAVAINFGIADDGAAIDDQRSVGDIGTDGMSAAVDFRNAARRSMTRRRRCRGCSGSDQRQIAMSGRAHRARRRAAGDRDTCCRR